MLASEKRCYQGSVRTTRYRNPTLAGGFLHVSQFTMRRNVWDLESGRKVIEIPVGEHKVRILRR